MEKIIVTLPATQETNYSIIIGSGLLKHPSLWLSQWQDKYIVIITDDIVKTHYGNQLLNTLQAEHFKVLMVSFKPGELSKQYHTKMLLEETMFNEHCGRDSLILALGGGVVGDLAGFIAATFMRGIPYMQLPTSLLAMVDSSIGGKTGIDTSSGKNLIGCFHQPKATIIDTDCLLTLPKEHMINGLIEAVKIGLTCDCQHFNFIEKQLEDILDQKTRSILPVIERAVQLKADIVSRDEKENQLRMVLNFGHTIGHAIEMLSKYTLLHGRAVAMGILVEAKIAQNAQLLSSGQYERIRDLFLRLGIQGRQLKSFDTEAIIKATYSDKKTKAGKTRYVLLKDIGNIYTTTNAIAQPVSDDRVRQALIAVSEEI